MAPLEPSLQVVVVPELNVPPAGTQVGVAALVTPVPVRDAVVEMLSVLSVAVSVPVKTAEDSGENVTLTVQLPPAASGDEQLLVWE